MQADERVAQLDQAEGKIDDARNRLLGILKSGPSLLTQLSVELQLLTLEEQAQNFPAAIQYCRRILELDPDNVKALSDLAELISDSPQQLDEALKLAQRAKEIAPENAYVADTLGLVFYRKGLYPVALQHFEYAASTQGATAIHKCHLALAYFKLNRPKQGQDMLDAARRLDPSVAATKVYREAVEESKKKS
jgi:tetratricopeptide (TPR) repeat protein